mgnify:CR=1 FL=1
MLHDSACISYRYRTDTGRCARFFLRFEQSEPDVGLAETRQLVAVLLTKIAVRRCCASRRYAPVLALPGRFERLPEYERGRAFLLSNV